MLPPELVGLRPRIVARVVLYERHGVLRCGIFILLGLQRSKGGVLEDGFSLDDWSGSGGAREGGVREHVWRLAGRESKGGALEVWRFLLLVNGLRERSRLTAVTVQPDLVLGVLGEGVVYGEVRLVLAQDRH